ncbi:MAG: TetR/AcrR family transcriptional regulator [Chloroflexi bacterium]|nr:TetR/AcrR family transcriptional regulator [Chloroflexota bacterium]
MMTDTDSNARREAILDAALEVFAEVGYNRATIKAIAQRAGIKSPALLYWYFPGKADLMRGVIARSVPAVAPEADLSMLVEQPITLTLKLVATAILSIYQDPKTVRAFRIIFSELLHNPDSNLDVLQAGPTRMLDLLRQCFTAGIARGELRPHNVEVSSRMFVGSLIINILATAIVPILGAGLPPPSEYVDQAISQLLDGLRAESRSEL